MPSVVRRMAPQSAWESDSAATACFLCGKPFGALTRRHHCRECGRVVCNKCSDNSVAMTNTNGVIEQAQRCCDSCYRAQFTPPQPAPVHQPPRPAARAKSTTSADQVPSEGEQSENVSEHNMTSASAAAAEAAAAQATAHANARAALAESEANARSSLATDEFDGRSTIVMARSADAARIAHALARKRQISAPALSTLRNGQWARAKVAEGIEVKAVLLPGATKKAAMAVIDLPEADFLPAVSAVTDAEFLRKLEPTLLSAESRQDPEDDGVVITVTKYNSAGIISARDFVTVTADHSLTPGDCAGIIPLAAGETLLQAYIHASSDYPHASQNAGFVRGTIHCHAYIVGEVAQPAGRVTTRLVHVTHADPKGSIPAFALEQTFGDIAKRLVAIRKEVGRRTESHRHLMASDALNAGDDASRTADRQIRSSRDAHAHGSESFNRQHVDPTNNGEAAVPEASQDAADEGVLEPVEAERQEASEPAAATAAAAAEDEEEEEEVEEIVEATPEPPKPPIGLTPKKAAVADLLIKSHKTLPWRLSKTLDNCDLEDAAVPYCDKKALRITTTMKASLATLEAFLSDASQLRKYDPTLDFFEVLPPAPAADDPDGTTVVYSSYKRATRLIAPRDFCVESAMIRLHDEEAKASGLGSNGQVVFISASRNSKRKPDQKGYTRGLLHMYGFICVASAFDAAPITVYNIMCVDPMGSIPAWLVDAAQAESCKKLAKIRSLVEERHRVNPAKPVAVAVPPPEPPVVRTQKRTKPAKAKSAEAAAADPAKAPQESAPAATEEAKAASPGGTSASTEDEDDFHSCVDEDEYMAERQEMRNFHEEEVARICANLTKTHVGAAWSAAKMVEGCKVQSASVDGVAVKAQRISTEFKCSLEQFKSIVSSTRTTYLIDPTVETVEVLQSPPFGTVIYTSYRSGSRLLSNRDFCTLTATKVLSNDEGAALGLYTKGINSSSFVVSSVNSTDMPECNGYVRGQVIAFGFIVVATPPDARRVRVFHIACVDPKGNIPAKLIDAAVAETCKKVNRLRELCEEAQAKVDAEARAEAAAAAASNPEDGAAHAAGAPERPVQTAHSVIERPFVELQTNRKWAGAHQVGPCRVETQPVLGTDVTAHRVSLEMKCSIATFEAVMNTTSVASEIDPSLEVIRVQESKKLPNASCVYTSYRSGSRMFSNRDFCTLTTSRVLGVEEGADLGLYTVGIATKAFMSCSVDGEEVAAQKDYVRGKVHAFGYLALATPPNARRVRVFNIAAIHPGGSVSPKMVKGIIAETCAKLQRLRVVCEEREAEAAMTMREVPEPEVTPSAAASPQNASGGDLAGAEEHSAQTAANDDGAAADTNDDDAGREASPDPVPVPEAESSTEVVASPHAAPSLESQPAKEPMPAGIRGVLRPLLDLHLSCSTWKKVKVLHECILEDTPVSFSDKHAQRITTTVQCSLKTFMAFLSDERMLRKFDPTLATVEHLLSPDEGDVVYTAYKQATRLIAPRDFCTINTRVSLTPELAEINNIQTQGRHAIITNAVDSTAKSQQRGYVRGRVHLFGYFATADSFDTVPITVHNLLCVDPSGSIPGWVVEVAITENIKKLAKIRELARSYHVALLNRRSSNLSN